MTSTSKIGAALILALALVASAGRLSAQSGYDLFQKALAAERADGNLRQAIQLYQRVVKEAASDRTLVARALVRMGDCYAKLGDPVARQMYERVVREFGDQAEAAQARSALAVLVSKSGRPSGPVDRQIWSGIDSLYPTSPSADGRYLSFTDPATGDLAVRDLTGGVSRRLTNQVSVTWDDFADASLVSPDGRHVAYAWFTGATSRTDLRVIPLTRDRLASPRIVHASEETLYVVPAAWTADGKGLVIVRTLADGTHQIALISLGDGSIRPLKSLDWRWPTRVSLSPDGRYIAYDVPARDDDAARDIFLLASDGSRETVAVQHRANDHSPLWSPDGTDIIFLSDRTGSASLWTVAVESGKRAGAAALLQRDVGQITPLGITRSGALYYVAGGGKKNVYLAQIDREMRLASAPVLATERHVNSNSTPAWSPDGQTLAYLSRRGIGDVPGSLAIVVQTLATGEERDVPLRISIRPPVLRWFPDSRSVLVASRDLLKSRFLFYRVDVATGTATLLHSTRSRVRNGNLADLSSDGARVFYIDSDVGSRTEQLMRYDIATGQATVLRSMPGRQLGSLAVSPDGTQVAYLVTDLPAAQGSTTLEVIGSEGIPRVVFRAPTWGVARFHGLAWTSDSRQLLFVRADEAPGAARPAAFWRVSVSGGEPEAVKMALGAPARPGVHPDGKRLVFEVEEPGSLAVWALENALPAAASRR